MAFDGKFLADTLERSLADPVNFHLPTGISRFDYGHQHGWWVRLTRDGVQFQKMFNDSHFPTFDDGLRAAILYRHEVLESFPLEIKSKKPTRGLLPAPESRVHRKSSRGKNRPYIYWEATWYDTNHKVQSQSFSVVKYGEENAHELALKAANDRHNYAPKLIPVRDPHLAFKFTPISREDVEVLSTINSGTYSGGGGQGAGLVDVDPFGFEGARKFELHLAIERDRALRDAKVAAFLEQYGSIHCELCSFHFKSVYPFLEKDIIEVHHIVPLAALSETTKVELKDLMLLCSNCHLAVHQGDAEENLIYAMEHFDGRRSADR